MYALLQLPISFSLGMKSGKDGSGKEVCHCPNGSVPEENGACPQVDGSCDETQFPCGNNLCIHHLWSCKSMSSGALKLS